MDVFFLYRSSSMNCSAELAALNGCTLLASSDPIPNKALHPRPRSAAHFNGVLSVIAARRRDKTLYVASPFMRPVRKRRPKQYPLMQITRDELRKALLGLEVAA